METLMHNPFYSRPERIFVQYKDVVKSPYPLLLNQIVSRFRSTYDEYLYLDGVQDLDMNNLTRLCIQRTDKNIFEYLAKKEFDYDTALKDIESKFANLYRESEPLSIGRSLGTLKHQKFTEKIFVYTEEYDARIHKDIQDMYHDLDKVTYITGDFVEIIKDLNITCYILSDVNYIRPIFHEKQQDYTNILLGTYGYNYLDSDSEELKFKVDIESLFEGNNIFKFATFAPEILTEAHFTQLIDG